MWTNEHSWPGLTEQVSHSSSHHHHHPFNECTGPGKAHYIKVLSSSRKSPTVDAQHLVMSPHRLMFFFLQFSAQVSLLQGNFPCPHPCPPPPTRVTDTMFLPFALGLVTLSLLSPPRSIPRWLIPRD